MVQSLDGQEAAKIFPQKCRFPIFPRHYDLEMQNVHLNAYLNIHLNVHISFAWVMFSYVWFKRIIQKNL